MVYFNSFIGYFSIILGCVMGAMSVESMLLQWVCLEVNMLCIIPILLGSSTQDSIMCGVKYFISQSAASVSFLFSILLMDSINLLSVIAITSILFKLGVPPFHSWMMGIIFNINLMEIFLILTVQKFIPLLILSQLGLNESLLMLLMFISAGFIIVNTNANLSLQFMLFLSSVGNGMWMIAGVMGGVWWMFLLMYSLMLLGAVVSLLTSKMIKFSDAALVDTSKKIEVALQFFNLGGVPPLMGFAVKLMVLKNLIFLSLGSLMTLVFISVMILYVYISMMFQVYTVTPVSFSAQSSSGSSKFLSLNTSIMMMFSLTTWLIL